VVEGGNELLVGVGVGGGVGAEGVVEPEGVEEVAEGGADVADAVDGGEVGGEDVCEVEAGAEVGLVGARELVVRLVRRGYRTIVPVNLAFC